MTENEELSMKKTRITLWSNNSTDSSDIKERIRLAGYELEEILTASEDPTLVVRGPTGFPSYYLGRQQIEIFLQP